MHVESKNTHVNLCKTKTSKKKNTSVRLQKQIKINIKKSCVKKFIKIRTVGLSPNWVKQKKLLQTLTTN